MDDCDNLIFYSPKNKIGGYEKNAKCSEVQVKVPNELREPTDVITEEIQYIPEAILVYNTPVTVQCPEGTVITDNYKITVPADTFSDYIYIQNITDISDTVLEYIAKNKLEADITTQLKQYKLFNVDADGNASKLLQEFINFTKLSLEQTLNLIQLYTDKLKDVNKQAEAAAYANLDCYYLSKPMEAVCPGLIKPYDVSSPTYQADLIAYYEAEQNIDEYYNKEEYVSYIRVPYGYFKSELSQEIADKLAENYALAQLNCIFANGPITVSCTDEYRPDRPAEWDADPTFIPDEVDTFTDHEWSNKLAGFDENDVKPPRPVGQASVSKGQFLSTESKEDADMQATIYAYSLLNCVYLNEEKIAECEDKNARSIHVLPSSTIPVYSNAPDPGQHVTVPYGYLNSIISKSQVNEEAQTLAESLLECCFVNPRLTGKCEVYYDPDTGESIDASYIHDPGQETTIIIEEGEFASCNSQEEATELAQNYLMTLLEECYYCNKIVPPTCVPQFVIDASTLPDGVTVSTAFTDTYGTRYNVGDKYKLGLPIDYTNIYNPYTGTKEDPNEWSIDATAGYPANSMCVLWNEIPQLEPLVDSIVPTLKQQREVCEYENDLVIAGCKLDDPLSDNVTDLEPYIFISKYDPDDPDACISEDLSYPKVGSYVEVPKGTFRASEYDIPRIKKYRTNAEGNQVEYLWPILPGEDGYVYGMNAADVKEYVNKQATVMAESMLECVFANPLTFAQCDGKEELTLCPDTDFDENHFWRFVKEIDVASDREFLPGSNTYENPVIIPANTFTSYVSKQEVLTQTYAFAMSITTCLYGNLAQTCDCDDIGMGKSDFKRGGSVPANMFMGDDPEALDQQAKAIACAMVVCFDLPQGKIGKTGPMGPPGPAGPAGPPGQDGPPGANGKNGQDASSGSCEGECMGVYV